MLVAMEWDPCLEEAEEVGEEFSLRVELWQLHWLARRALYVDRGESLRLMDELQKRLWLLMDVTD